MYDPYEMPRAEYPFDALPEPDKHTDLGPGIGNAILCVFSYKREAIRRFIDMGHKRSELFWGESIEDLAREVGLLDYYQSKNCYYQPRNGNKA